MKQEHLLIGEITKPQGIRGEVKIRHYTDDPDRFFDLDEALMQLESIGSEFLVFINAETDRVNVVYRRRIGGYAVIDPVL